MDVSYFPALRVYQHANKEIATYFEHQPDSANDLLCLCKDCCSWSTQLDFFAEPVDDQTYVDAISGNIFPSRHFPGEVNFTCADEFNFYNYPKRIKASSNPSTSAYVLRTVVNNESWLYNSYIPRGLCPELHPFPVGLGQEEKTGTVEMSAQTVAARLRRKKISDRTQQLGKLVPGGSMMITAEMYLAAFKYVKFMEAQIGILKLMVSLMEIKNPDEVQNMHALLSSSKVQERLYEEAKCLVSSELVKILARGADFIESICFQRVQSLNKINYKQRSPLHPIVSKTCIHHPTQATIKL